MRRNRLTDDEPLGLREQAFCGHGPSNPPTGLADGLEIGSSLPAFALHATAWQALCPFGLWLPRHVGFTLRRDSPLGRDMRPAGSPASRHSRRELGTPHSLTAETHKKSVKSLLRPFIDS